MKKSLQALKVDESGIKAAIADKSLKPDKEVFQEASKIEDLKERENYLREELKTKPGSHVKSIPMLIDLIKTSDKAYASDLVLALAQNDPLNPRIYYIFANLALSNQAYEIAESMALTSKWLNLKEEDRCLKDIEPLLKRISEESLKSEDDSNSPFWALRKVDYFWILERVYYRKKRERLVDFAIGLLEVFPRDINSYKAVFKILKEDVNGLKDFIGFLDTKSELNDEFKFFYLGASNYYLKNTNESIDFLINSIKAGDLQNPNNTALLYQCLNFIQLGDKENFPKVFKLVKPDNDALNMAVFFFYCVIAEVEVLDYEYPNERSISY